MDKETPALEFLCVTMYDEDITELRSFYRDVLGLPVAHEAGDHITAMDKVCVHDDSEDPAKTVRLCFLTDDAEAFAAAAELRGAQGEMGTDAFAKPMWTSVDPLGNSVRVLTRPRRDS